MRLDAGQVLPGTVDGSQHRDCRIEDAVNSAQTRHNLGARKGAHEASLLEVAERQQHGHSLLLRGRRIDGGVNQQINLHTALHGLMPKDFHRVFDGFRQGIQEAPQFKVERVGAGQTMLRTGVGGGDR